MVLKKKSVSLRRADVQRASRSTLSRATRARLNAGRRHRAHAASGDVRYLNEIVVLTVGRIDIVENRFVGMKSRGCYETPGGTVLNAAHLDLEILTMDREVMRIRDGLSLKYAELVYNGYWFSPEMDFLNNAMDHAQRHVTGSVDIQLHKGNVINVGRSSLLSLYSEDLVSMTRRVGLMQR